MNQCTSKWLAAAALMAIVATIADPAWAQRGRGFGRERNFSPATVATLEVVQADLKLTDEQKTAVATINDEMRSDMRELFTGGGPPDREAFAQLNADASAKLDQALEPAQVERLREITLQVNGAQALADAKLREQLKFTDEQNKQFEEARAANREAMQEMADLSREERRENREEFRSAANERLLAVLTPEQKTEFEAMQGAPLEIDLSELRGRFGGGRRGGNN